MYTFYEDLQTLDNKLGSNRETLHFLKAYHEKIAELFTALKLREALELLIIYDHDNKEMYEYYLKIKHPRIIEIGDKIIEIDYKPIEK